MAARKYEPGQMINGILFLRELPKINTNPHRRGAFQCPHCENEIHIWFANIVSGNTKSCGCQQRLNRPITHGESGERTGKRTVEYRAWAAMKARCYNKGNKEYYSYGGRGIMVCERWLNSYENFIEDMGRKPGDEYSIDRIDNNGNYEPGNCRWATDLQQLNNTSRNVFIEYNGERKTASQWAKFFNISQHSILWRHKKGMTLEKVFSKNKLEKQNVIYVTYMGGKRRFVDLCKELNLGYSIIMLRKFRRKISVQESFDIELHKAIHA